MQFHANFIGNSQTAFESERLVDKNLMYILGARETEHHLLELNGFVG